MLVMNGTTSVPKSVLRYTMDKVRQESETEVKERKKEKLRLVS